MIGGGELFKVGRLFEESQYGNFSYSYFLRIAGSCQTDVFDYNGIISLSRQIICMVCQYQHRKRLYSRQIIFLFSLVTSDISKFSSVEYKMMK